MRALIRLLLASSLSLTAAALPGCKDKGATNNAGNVDKPDRVAGMPKPYRIPATPEMAAYVEAPDEALAASHTYARGVLPRGRGLLLTAMSASPEDFDRKLAQMVDLNKPWAGAYLENQNIMWLPIETASVAQLKALLTAKTPVGKFGAVSLERAAAGPKLAWFDEKEGYLALADDEKGLSTAQALPFELSKRGKFYLTITSKHASRFVSGVPFSRATVEGVGPHDFTLVTEDTDVSQVPDLAKATEGTMGGIFEAKQVAAGVSTKYAGHVDLVKKIMSDTRRLIDRQLEQAGLAGALAKGNLDDLHRRLGSMLRSWNGRLAVGVGPKGHVLLGFGANDPKKMAGATHHFLQGINDNISTAKSFGIGGVPSVKFRKNRTSAAGHNIATFVVEKAHSRVPKEWHPLILDNGDLRIAMAFPPRAGGAMVVVGRNAPTVMEQWLEATKNATPASETGGDLAVAMLAVEPSTLQALDGMEQRAAISKALQLAAEKPPTTITVSREDMRYTFRVKGPKVDPSTLTARAAPAHSGRRAPPRSGPRAAPARRTAGRPTNRPATRAAKPMN